MLKLPHKIFILIVSVATVTIFFTAISSYQIYRHFFSYEIEENLSTICKMSADIIDGNQLEHGIMDRNISFFKHKLKNQVDKIKKLTETERIILLNKKSTGFWTQVRSA